MLSAQDSCPVVALSVCVATLGCGGPSPEPKVPQEATPVTGVADVTTPTAKSSTAPPGVSAQLWSDIHWLPPNVAGINGTKTGTLPLVARWVFSQPFATSAPCKALEDGLDGGYGIEWAQPPQSFVFYARVELETVEACASSFMDGLGGSARMHDRTLYLRQGDTESRVMFAQRDEQLVAVVDDGRLGAIETANADRLSANVALVEALTRVDTSEAAWGASTTDMTRVALGIPSRGYLVHSDAGPTTIRLQFLFDDAAEAGRALTASTQVIQESEAFLGISLSARVSQDENVLVASLNLTEFSSLDPTKLQALQTKLATPIDDTTAQ